MFSERAAEHQGPTLPGHVRGGSVHWSGQSVPGTGGSALRVWTVPPRGKKVFGMCWEQGSILNALSACRICKTWKIIQPVMNIAPLHCLDFLRTGDLTTCSVSCWVSLFERRLLKSLFIYFSSQEMDHVKWTVSRKLSMRRIWSTARSDPGRCCCALFLAQLRYLSASKILE